MEKRIKEGNLPWGYLVDYLFRGSKGFEYGISGKFYKYLLENGICPRNYYMITSNVSKHDLEEATEPGYRITCKTKN